MANIGLQQLTIGTPQHHLARSRRRIAKGTIGRRARRQTAIDQVMQLLTEVAIFVRTQIEPARQSLVDELELAALIDRIEADRRLFHQIGKFLMIAADIFRDLALRPDNIATPPHIAWKCRELTCANIYDFPMTA